MEATPERRPVTDQPTIGVLAVQGDVREHLRMLEATGAQTRLVRRAAELTGLSGVVLPGGESTTMHKLLVAFGLLKPLRELIGTGLPTLGTCAGMILLADRIESGAPGQETIGGLDITVRRNAFGRQVDSFEAEIDFAGFDSPLPAVFIRAPEVEKVGDRVEVLATVATGFAAARIVAVRQEHLLATSFHPEITGDDRVHRCFVDLVRSQGAR